MPLRKKPKARSRRANGRLLLDGRTRRGRRLAELIAAFGSGHNLSDEETVALIRSSASLQVEIEALEDKIDHCKPVDHDMLTKLINTRDRSFERLKEMRTQARSPAERKHPPGLGGWTSELQRHLHYLVWTRPFVEHYAKGTNDPALIAEYERLEAEGAFKDMAK
jgi:hypothetical protein